MGLYMLDGASETRTCILLNGLGDVEISWDSSDDDEMRKIIQKKMDEGVSFFIMTPLIGSFLQRRKKIASVDELDRFRIQIRDADIEKMFEAGKISVFRSDAKKIDTVRRAETADEAVRNDTVAARPFVGG